MSIQEMLDGRLRADRDQIAYNGSTGLYTCLCNRAARIGWHMYLEGNSVNPAYTGAAESLGVSRGN